MNEARASAMNENRGYNLSQTTKRETWMAKLLADKPGAFGRRLAQARNDAGYTQQELADEVGATRRMIAYYETESDYPPTNMLAGIAQALNVTSDELLGMQPLKKAKKPDTRLPAY